MERRIEFQLNETFVLIRPEQCSMANIKASFGIDRNASIVLKKSGTDEIEFPNTDGQFENLQGFYKIIVNGENEERRGESVGLATYDRFASFEAPRVPIRRNVRRSLNTGGDRIQLEVDVGSQRRGRTLDSIHRGGQGNVDVIRRNVETTPVQSSPAVTEVTVYFNLAKRNIYGEIVVAVVSGVSEVPVSIGIMEAQDIDKLNSKISTIVNSMEELRSYHAASFYIIRPNTFSRMLNSEEMKKDGLAYWTRIKRSGRKFLILASGGIDPEEDDEEDEFITSKRIGYKRKCGSDAVIVESFKKLKIVVKSSNDEVKNILTTIRNEFKTSGGGLADIKALEKKVEDGEKSLKGLVQKVKDLFQCKYCLGVATNPKICKKCNVIIGCELCVKMAGDTEKINNGQIYEHSGTWECPQQCGNYDVVSGEEGTIKVRLDTTFIEKWEEGNVDGED